MRKQLPTDGIANELAGSSVFFQPAKDGASEVTPAVETKYEPTPERLVVVQRESMPPPQAEPAPTGSSDDVIPRHHDTRPSGNREIVTAAKPVLKAESKPESNPALDSAASLVTLSPDVQEELRKAVKQLGKEAATHRFTPDEKRQIADIVYTYACQGVRTSENEITRIAVNWLLLDYHRRGLLSVLSKLLESLHG